MTLEEILLSKMMEGKKVKLGASFRNYIYQDSVNKLDALLEVNGVDEILFNSEFIKVKEKLGYHLARDGRGWGLVAYSDGADTIISLARFADYEKVLGKLVCAVLYTGVIRSIEKTSYYQAEKWVVENGKVVKEMGWIIDEQAGSYYTDIEIDRVVYNTTTIPAWPFEHNANGDGDIPAELIEAIDTMDYFSNQIPKEWEKVKQQFLHNKAFESNKSGKDIMKAMQNGESVHEVTDPNGQLGGALATLTAGSATPDILQNQIVFLENRILKYAFKSTDLVMGKAAQQSTLEMSKIDRTVLEQLTKMNKLRKYNYDRFFKALGELVGVNITTELPLPPIDQFQIDNLEADLAVKRGQAASQMSVAQNASITNQNEPVVEGE